MFLSSSARTACAASVAAACAARARTSVTARTAAYTARLASGSHRSAEAAVAARLAGRACPAIVAGGTRLSGLARPCVRSAAAHRASGRRGRQRCACTACASRASADALGHRNIKDG